ncbi:MAG: hypothetical protein ABSB33_13630 [Tepidisphaeraceae bacterium]|jgi:hypothetical protein
MPARLQIMLGIAAVLVSICAVVVSLAQLIVSRAQWKVANTNSKFQLFDRRRQVKEAVLDLASCYIRELSITGEAYGKFQSSAVACRFLCPEDAAAWIASVGKDAWRLMDLSGQLKLANDRPQRDETQIKKLFEEKLELGQVFWNLFNEADTRLDVYLKIQ